MISHFGNVVMGKIFFVPEIVLADFAPITFLFCLLDVNDLFNALGVGWKAGVFTGVPGIKKCTMKQNKVQVYDPDTGEARREEPWVRGAVQRGIPSPNEKFQRCAGGVKARNERPNKLPPPFPAFSLVDKGPM